jgi:hypothetical protein
MNPKPAPPAADFYFFTMELMVLLDNQPQRRLYVPFVIFCNGAEA